MTKGVKLTIEGDCNDYVGKGLSGGTIVVYRLQKLLASNENTIIGNRSIWSNLRKIICIRTSWREFDEKFTNHSIVEGCGAHGCEYMTGGTAIILGEVGDNFGAGMTGGMAFIYDEKNTFENFVNQLQLSGKW